MLKGIFSALNLYTFTGKTATMKKSTLLFLLVFSFGFPSLAQQVYPYYKNGLWGFVDEKKNVLVQPQYSDAREFVYGLAAVQKNKKWGAVNTRGKIIIPIQYDRILANDFGYYEVTTGLVEMDVMSGKKGIYDTAGKLILPLEYSYLSSGDFEEGSKLAHFTKNGKYGFMDRKCKIIVPAVYDMVSGFEDGLATVQKNGKTGFIDEKGTLVIPMIYGDAYSFSEGLAAVEKNGKWGWIDKKGKEVIPFKYDKATYFDNGVANVEMNDKLGLIDKSGRELIPCENSYPYFTFYDGLQYRDMKGKKGYVDQTGKMVIEASFDFAGDFENGIAWVKKNSKWGRIDKTGKTITDFIYDDVRRPSANFMDKERKDAYAKQIYFKQDGKWGLMDDGLKVIIQPKFEDMYWYSPELINVKQEGKWGLIDTKGNFVLKPFAGGQLYPSRQNGLAYCEIYNPVTDKSSSQYVTLKGLVLSDIVPLTGGASGGAGISNN